MMVSRLFVQNPELRRQFWLEISPQRLILLPIVLFAITALIYSPARLWFLPSAVLAALSLWAPFAVTSSMEDERSNATWDNQRLSAQSAGQLVVGKIFGGAIYAWYGALCCLLLIVLYQVGSGSASKMNHPDFFFQPISFICLQFLLVGLLAQSSALALTSGSNTSNAGAKIGYILPLAFSFIIVPYILSFRGSESAKPVLWHGFSISSHIFAIASLLFFNALGLMAAHQGMRRELQEKTMPWLWLFGLLAVMLWIAGITPQRDPPRDRTAYEIAWDFHVPLIIALIGMWFQLFKENHGFVGYRRLVLAWQQKRWCDVAHLWPRWSIALALAVLVMVVGATTEFVLPFALALLLLAARDAALLIALSNQRRIKRPLQSWMAYLFILYGLLPWILHALGAETLGNIFMPLRTQRYNAGTHPQSVQLHHSFLILLQTLAAMGWVGVLWRREQQARLSGTTLSKTAAPPAPTAA
jgi:hypothetical protein